MVRLYFLSNLSVFYFFKQKTAYELRISDWSSDVCSSDLAAELSADFVWPTPPVLDEDRLAWKIVAADFVLGLGDNRGIGHVALAEIGRASCRERVCQYV